MGPGGVEIIAAPSNLGLRPPAPNHEPGTWKAPAALLSAGISGRLGAAHIVELARPPYAFEEQPGTRIRNGLTIRDHALTLAVAGEEAQTAPGGTRGPRRARRSRRVPAGHLRHGVPAGLGGGEGPGAGARPGRAFAHPLADDRASARA